MWGSRRGSPGNGKFGMARIVTPWSGPTRCSVTTPRNVNDAGSDDGVISGESSVEGVDGDVAPRGSLQAIDKVATRHAVTSATGLMTFSRSNQHKGARPATEMLADPRIQLVL